MNIGITFDYKRFMLMSRLKEHGGRLVLALAEKEAMSVQKLFEDRARLHEYGYQHKGTKKTDRMVLDALLSADKHLNLCYNKEGSPVPLSEACDDMYTFSQLTDDYVFNTIRHSRIPELAHAKQIANRISRRTFYKIVGSVKSKNMNLTDRMEELEKSLFNHVEENAKLLRGNDLVLSLKRISTGLGRKKPVERVLFFDSRGRCKNYNSKYLREMMNIEEESVFVMLRREGDDLIAEAKEIVRGWLNIHFDGDEYEHRSS